MPTNFTKTYRVPFPRGAWNATGADIAANLCLVPAAAPQVGDLPSVAVPATGATPKIFAGASMGSKLINGRAGDVALNDGDETLILADVAGGTITAGDRLTISTTAGKEGYVKTDTNANVLKVGWALEAATADGQLIRVKLAPTMAEA